MNPQDTSFLVNGFKPTVAAVDPATAMAKVQAVRNAQQQNQLTSAQIQEAQIGVQEKQRDLNDQKILGDAMAQSGGDIDKALPVAMKNGLSPKGMFGMQQMLLKNQETKASIGKNLADAASARTTAQEKSNQMVVGTTGAMLALPPDQQAAAYPAAMKKLAQDMGIDPATLPQDFASFGGTPALQQFHDQHMTNLEQLATQKAAQEKAAADQKLVEDQAEAARKAKLAPALQTKAENEAVTTTPNAAGLTPAQAKEAADRKAALDQKTLNDRMQRGIDAGKLKIEQQKFNATFGAGLDANGKPLSPEDRKAAALMDPTAVAQANYQIAGPSAMRTTPLGNMQMAKILAINPNYDGTKFAERNKIAQDFSAAGASGKSMTSADTALAHLDTISKAGVALKNGDVKVLNEFANQLGAQIGASPKNTYDTIISMVAPEVSKAVIGEAGAASEREKMEHNFASDTADPVREQAIGAAAGLLGARVHKMSQAYESDMGKPLERKLSPESQSVLDRYTGGGQAAAAIPTPATQKDYNALPKGAKFLKPGDKTIYTKQQ